MKTKRVLSFVLAACMLISLVPAVTLPARSATNADPVYNRAGTPEVAIFNAHNGKNENFFKSQMSNHFYNAVEAGEFRKVNDSTWLLSCDAKITKNETYVWNRFYDSNLAYLSDKYQELQAGYAVTRTSSSHTHRWQLIYSADLTSYMSTDLYLNDEATNQYWSIAHYTSFSRTGSTIRQGNKEFHSLGYTINGKNSRYMTISGVNQSGIRKKMYVNFVNSTLYYDGQKKTCTCGGSANGAMVSFYDGVAPTIKSIEIKNGDVPCTNFKAGDTVTIVLNCSEAIRFADDSKSGKGDVYIGLMVDGLTNNLHAHLTRLDNESLTFVYTIPNTETRLFTVNAIDLRSAPNGGTALVHYGVDIPLKQVYGGSANRTYTAQKPTMVFSDLGYSKTTSWVTDMAGNELNETLLQTAFYIDCEKPYIGVAAVSADTKNRTVKEALGKVNEDPGSVFYRDNSDIYLGTGDEFSLTLYMNEVVTGSGVTVKTNIKKADGTDLTLTSSDSSVIPVGDLGTQYGLGASDNHVTVFYMNPVTIAPGMKIDNSGAIQITGVTFTDVQDASANVPVSSDALTVLPNKAYYVDTVGPTISQQAPVQGGGVNSKFYVPFTVTDDASLAAGLPASLTVLSGDSTAHFYYALTDSATAPADNSEDWIESAFQTSIPFTQTGALQYLHIMPKSRETYCFSSTDVVRFSLEDYAGNTGQSDASLAGVMLDTAAPSATALHSSRSFAGNEGTLTVTIRAEDDGGLKTVQYQWTEPSEETPTGTWINAVGSLDNNPVSAELTASATVPNLTAFRKKLWVKAADVAGNSNPVPVGEFSYNLSALQYVVDRPSAITTAAEMYLRSLESGGRLLFEVKKDGDSDSYYLYADTSSPFLETQQNPDAPNLLRSHLGNWNESGRDTLRYDWWKGSSSKADDTTTFTFNDRLNTLEEYLRGYTGNLRVTIYSGRDMLIQTGKDGSKHTVTVKNGAGVEPITLRLSPSGNTTADVFTGETLFTADEQTLSRLESHVRGIPWSFASSVSVCDTLENIQVRIDLNGDKNGWDFEDVDWLNSFIALYPGNQPAPATLSALEAKKLCGVGSGANQTVTLPAFDYASGYYRLALVLRRHSDKNSYYTALLQNGAENVFVYIDATEPGKLETGVLAKMLSDYDGLYEQIVYDPDSTIYIPTQGYDVRLAVEALDRDGQTINCEGDAGAHIYAGAMDVIAWNTAAPETKISLSRAHLVCDEIGVWEDQTQYSYPRDGKRLLRFGAATVTASSGFPEGILGVTPGQDNVIALQVKYANGRASAVTYLTVHPTQMSLEGTISTSPAVDESAFGPFSQYTTSGLITADPGTASITFTPASGSNTAGMKLYCQEGCEYARGLGYSYDMYDGFAEEVNEMTLQSDGSYVWQVTDADAEAYESACAAFEADPDNNPIPDRFPGIFEPGEEGCRNAILEGARPVGYYVIYAKDLYGNLTILGVTKNAIISDRSAPVVTGTSLTAENGAYTATYKICDDSLYAFGRDNGWNDKAMSRPMTLNLCYDDAYAAAIGAEGESLTLTADAGGESYVWKAETANKMGIYEVDAVLTRDGSFEGDDGMSTYFHGATDVYLTVTVKGMVSPQITGAANMTLKLVATDAHGNNAAAVGLTAGVTGVAPAVTAMEFNPIEMTPRISDLALFVTFNQPVQPAETWINRSISGYDTVWQDAFPITNDGTWEITFTDVFGTVYTIPVNTFDYKGGKDSAFGVYGFDLSFSTLDYVPAAAGVTITASYTGTDGDSLHIWKGDEPLTSNYDDDLLVNRTAQVTSNGDYTIYLYGESYWTEKLHVHLENVVSGGPEETLYFYFDEFKEEYAAGAEDRYQGVTTGPVTVSYRTSRPTSPVGNTTVTLRSGEGDTFTLQYYDAPTDFTYTISGKLSDYGITLAAPEEPYEDKEAPAVDLVTVWTQKNGGFAQVGAFPGSADEATIKSAIEDSGYAQSYDFVVNASDYSKWKLVVKSAVPDSMSYASAVSDTIAGVSVSGNNVLVTKTVASDFYIVVVDNAKANSAATADNFTCLKIPAGSYRFDTTPPTIQTLAIADGLYSKTVYIKVTDTDDKGADTSGTVTVSGLGLEKNTNANYAEYPYKLVLRDNETVVVVTATDAAGNSSVANVQATGIDTSSPKLSVTWSPGFKDPATNTLDDRSPTAGPVNTDVTAFVASDKEISKVIVDGWLQLGPENTEYWDWYGSTQFTYNSQRITLCFTDHWETSYQLEIFAPNGKSTTTTITLGDNVIDKTPPLNGDVADYVDIEELVREGYTVPYAVECALYDDYEDIYCMNGGTAGVAYNENNPFTVELQAGVDQSYLFSDKAGNLTEVRLPTPPADYVDSVAPQITVSGLPDNANVTNGSVSFTVEILDETELTLSAGDDSVSFGALTEGTDSDGNKVWTGTVSAANNGTFRLTAVDSAGNRSGTYFTINNIDKTMPIISFDVPTVRIRQDSTAAELAALLDVNSENIHAWDNVGIRENTLACDVSGVDLSTPGIYAVPYTVQDTASNVGQATRYVRVFDKNHISVAVDGELTEPDGVFSINTGTHTLSIGGLKAANEPCKVQLLKGIWSAGQMKYATGGVTVGSDGRFTIVTPGFYTLFITTQSRQTYLVLLHVEN